MAAAAGTGVKLANTPGVGVTDGASDGGERTSLMIPSKNSFEMTPAAARSS